MLSPPILCQLVGICFLPYSYNNRLSARLLPGFISAGGSLINESLTFSTSFWRGKWIASETSKTGVAIHRTYNYDNPTSAIYLLTSIICHLPSVFQTFPDTAVLFWFSICNNAGTDFLFQAGQFLRGLLRSGSPLLYPKRAGRRALPFP